MKRITILGPNDIRYVEQEKPIPKANQVVVKVCYCGICGTDLELMTGESGLIKNGSAKYPREIGHEWSGIVESVGSAVTKFAPGDRVVGENTIYCGKCDSCQKEDYIFCEDPQSLGTTGNWPGAFAEYAVFPEYSLYHLPDNVSLEAAALIEPAKIAICGVKRCDIQKGDKVLVVGTGGIGLCAVALAKSLGAGCVIVAGRKNDKLAIAKKLGADILINTVEQNLKEALLRCTDGEGVDHIVETAGAMDILEITPELMNVSPITGKKSITLLGFYGKKLNNFAIDTIVLWGIRVQGLAGYLEAVADVIDLMEKGMDLTPLITHRYTFEEAIDAMKNAGVDRESKIKMMVKF